MCQHPLSWTEYYAHLECCHHLNDIKEAAWTHLDLPHFIDATHLYELVLVKYDEDICHMYAIGCNNNEMVFSVHLAFSKHL